MTMITATSKYGWLSPVNLCAMLDCRCRRLSLEAPPSQRRQYISRSRVGGITRWPLGGHWRVDHRRWSRRRNRLLATAVTRPESAASASSTEGRSAAHVLGSMCSLGGRFGLTYKRSVADTSLQCGLAAAGRCCVEGG